MKYLVITLLLASCGFNGEQKITTNDSTQTVETAGEAYTYFVMRLEFIDQIEELCRDLEYNESLSESEYDKAVAQCTFDKMSAIEVDLSNLQDLINQNAGE